VDEAFANISLLLHPNPGEAPELVPPEHALGISSSGSTLGDAAALESASQIRGAAEQ